MSSEAMARLLERASLLPGCRVRPPSRGLSTAAQVGWPEDLQAFHRLCGGLALFADSAYPVEIPPPGGVRPVNPVMLAEEYDDDRSSAWVIVAALRDGDYITMDLAPPRLGRCYDSSHEVHGVVGSCAVVARSFTEMLESFIDAGGGRWYWLEDGFPGLGDAYD